MSYLVIPAVLQVQVPAQWRVTQTGEQQEVMVAKSNKGNMYAQWCMHMHRDTVMQIHYMHAHEYAFITAHSAL